MKKHLTILWVAILGLLTFPSFAQIVLSSYPSIAANNGTAGVTFQLETSQDIILNEIHSQVFSTGTSTYTLYVRSGGVQSSPGVSPVISAANGWNMITSGISASGTGTAGPPVLFAGGLNLVLPAGIYGIYMACSNIGYKSHAGAPDTWNDATVTIRTGPNYGYGGAISPTFHPRQFCGFIDYNILATSENDAGVVSIDRPSNCEGVNDVVVTVKNFGINQINGVNINWTVDGVLQSPVTYNNTLDTFGGALPQTAQVSLGSVSLTAGITTDIVAWTELPNNQPDTVNDKDTAYKSVDPLPTITTFPYAEYFESGQGPWYIDGKNPSWAFGTPAKTTITGASSGSNAFVTGGLSTASHNNDENSYVNSPCFDFSNFQGTPWVALDVWWNCERGWDGGALQTSIDGGVTWETVGLDSDPYNWYTDSTLEGLPGGSKRGWTGRASEANSGSGGYVNAKHGLSESLIGEIVRFRVAFGADAATVDDGMAFDNFRVVDFTPAELGPDRKSLCQQPNTLLDPGINVNGDIIWSTGALTPTIQVANTGQYWVEYTDTLIDLVSSDTVMIIQSPPLVINWAFYDDTLYLDNVTTLNPRLPLDVEYMWTPGGYNFPYLVIRPSNYGPGTHVFTLHAEDSVQCSDDETVTIVILNETGIEQQLSEKVSVFPNPVTDILNIRLNGIEGQTYVEIYDVKGQLAQQHVVRANSDQMATVDMNQLEKGSYIVRLKNDQFVETFKLMKQ